MNDVNAFRATYKNSCRTCLSYLTSDATSIFTCSAVASTTRTEMFKSVLSACSIQITEDDRLPKFICGQCQVQLDNTLTFLEQCLQSQNILKEQQDVKFEFPARNDDAEKEKLIDVYNEKESSCEGLLDTSVVIKVDPDDDTEDDNQLSDSDELPLSLLSGIVKQEVENDITAVKVKDVKKYECDECSKSFKSLMFFLNHKVKHTGNYPHVCSICSDSFPTFQQIRRHMNTQHEGSTYCPYICQLCKETFESHYHLKRHEQSKHNGRLFPCNICKKYFSTLSSLKYHQNVHLGIRPFKCTSCGKSFTQPALLKEHMKNVHNEKKFICHCGKTFNRNQKLLIHIDSVHEKSYTLRKYACQMCDKKFHHPYTLKNHMNTHLGIKPFLCSVCAAAFSTQNNLQSHFKRIHTDELKIPEKRHLCSNCGDSFSRSSHLKRHILRKHTINVEKKFACPICNKKFLEKSDVSGHVRLHDDVKPFQCSECTKCFRDKWRRQHHVNRVHLGIRPFACTTCEMKFKTKSHLEKHIRTHTGEKPYACPHCTYMCAEKSNLKKHINIHFKSR